MRINGKWLSAAISVALLLLLCITVFATDLNNGFLFNQYPLPESQLLPNNFSLQMLNGTSMLYGIDVSEWEGTINWDALKSAVDFVIIRSSYGQNSVDKQITRNQSEARRVGILTGYYHYAYPEYNDPEPEADNFLNRVGPLRQGEILCLDFEEQTTKNIPDWCYRFMNRVYSKTNTRPLLYINYSLEKENDWTEVVNGDFGLWLATWDHTASFSGLSTQWPFVAFKQYTDSGTVAGMSPVDLDIFNGGRNQYMAYGYHVPAPTVTITSPTTAATYATGSCSLSIGGTVTTQTTISSVCWANDRAGSGTCTGGTSWSAGGITLQPGTNVITVTATDYYGQQGSDTLTVTYTPPTYAISGTVNFQDFKGSPAAVPVTLELRLHGGSTTSMAVNLDASGKFNVTNVPVGTYDLAFKANHWLRKTMSGVSINGNVSNLGVSLINGDVNGDNKVNMGDYVKMNIAWNSTNKSANWDACSDLNGDGMVNMGDYVILKKNWNIAGDN